ncbi:putative WD40 repeats [Trypoxylus dichotomus]
MELSGIVYPPNRPLERTMKPLQSPVLYDFLFFIEANERGDIILGSSNVAGTYWEGVLFHYKNFELAVTNVYNSHFVSNSTISDAKFIQNNQVLLAEDSGHLKLLTLPENEQQSIECKHDFDKDVGITQLTTWRNNKFAVSTGTSINLYDIIGPCIQSNALFRNYHTDTIFSIDANKLDENLFISASADRKACIWDIRMEIPATVLYNNEFSSLTAAAWNPLNSDYLIVGSEAGDIYLLNIKEPKDVLCTMHCFNSSIYKNREEYYLQDEKKVVRLRKNQETPTQPQHNAKVVYNLSNGKLSKAAEVFSKSFNYVTALDKLPVEITCGAEDIKVVQQDVCTKRDENVVILLTEKGNATIFPNKKNCRNYWTILDTSRIYIHNGSNKNKNQQRTIE